MNHHPSFLTDRRDHFPVFNQLQRFQDIRYIIEIEAQRLCDNVIQKRIIFRFIILGSVCSSIGRSISSKWFILRKIMAQRHKMASARNLLEKVQ